MKATGVGAACHPIYVGPKCESIVGWAQLHRAHRPACPESPHSKDGGHGEAVPTCIRLAMVKKRIRHRMKMGNQLRKVSFCRYAATFAGLP